MSNDESKAHYIYIFTTDNILFNLLKFIPYQESNWLNIVLLSKTICNKALTFFKNQQFNKLASLTINTYVVFYYHYIKCSFNTENYLYNNEDYSFWFSFKRNKKLIYKFFNSSKVIDIDTTNNILTLKKDIKTNHFKFRYEAIEFCKKILQNVDKTHRYIGFTLNFTYFTICYNDLLELYVKSSMYLRDTKNYFNIYQPYKYLYYLAEKQIFENIDKNSIINKKQLDIYNYYKDIIYPFLEKENYVVDRDLKY